MNDTWLKGVALPCPATGWSDRSMPAFAGPLQDGGPPPGITMSRDERRSPADPAGETFEACAKRQARVLEASLPGFQNRQPTSLRAGTDTARDLLLTGRAGAVSLTQGVVWMPMSDGSVLTCAATSESSRFERHRSLFEATLPRIEIAADAFAAG